jgi:antirestriction protein
LPVFRHIVCSTTALSVDNVDSIRIAAIQTKPVEHLDTSSETMDQIGTLKRSATKEVNDQLKTQQSLQVSTSELDFVAETPLVEPELPDGHWYLKLLERDCAQIRLRITQIESISIPESLPSVEEVSGRVRLAIGKANLLLNQKLKQFRELCEANLNQSADEQFSTRSQDLQGFWEMVSIQVHDIHVTFDRLEREASNNWIIDDQQSIPSKSKSIRTGKVTTTKANGSSKADSAKDEERRARLKEAKRKQMQALQIAKSKVNNESQSESVFMFMQPDQSENLLGKPEA